MQNIFLVLYQALRSHNGILTNTQMKREHLNIRGDAAAGAKLVVSAASFDDFTNDKELYHRQWIWWQKNISIDNGYYDKKTERQTWAFISEAMLQLERSWLEALPLLTNVMTKKNRKTFNFLLLTNTFISEVMLQLERGWLKAASFDNFSKAMKRQILYFLHLTNT